ncbi:MAG: hypothetical protein A2729_03700 [Candidatus Buchananbacteria bacterium RIFCSPHIGHO2_01_FULL_39_14]|uniref:Uncharacterized protein n=1 Tax=Candidatus Buchananbacteria bacterium RIFCSPHIGHO2_01_FULL_39_14 TaxID=1797532 RepID=A0A1G1XVC3_9BACT|nr:MAG: hypothetical protein A2729_03700 [Candidatus Buchananbacteria bacterium RIFCSPHIGHO2_01_FULL_39_14]
MIIDATLGYSWEYFVIDFADLIAVALFYMSEDFDDVLANLTFDWTAAEHAFDKNEWIYMFLCDLLINRILELEEHNI